MSLRTPEAVSVSETQFSWVPFYEELASKLKEYRYRQSELLKLLSDLREQGLKITPLWDQDEEGNVFPLAEIDPFTFFGIFNRQIKNQMRTKILKALKGYFHVEADVPRDFEGIPVLNNMSAIFFTYQYKRQPDAVDRLWELFSLALEDGSEFTEEFSEAFNSALEVKNTRYKLTMGLFWVRPHRFINMDEVNRQFLGVTTKKLNASSYKSFLIAAKETGVPFPKISLNAHFARVEHKRDTVSDSNIVEESPYFQDGTQYWLVGAYWAEQEPKDQTERFIKEGIWQNGYDDLYQEDVLAMQPGDKIIIKNTYTRKQGLPFESEGRTISCMDIKAIGTITENPEDGKRVYVDWDKSFQPKTWYFFTSQKTIWNLQSKNQFTPHLLAFVFEDKPQDYDFFLRSWRENVWNESKTINSSENEVEDDASESLIPEAYTVEDALQEGVFMTEAELHELLALLKEKKNVILQGPPGTGKTFLAKKLAYLIAEQRQDERIKMIQFHQSYSYEDFIRGYRPSMSKESPFELVDGPFYKFCKRAQTDPENPYIFIIDEINRGNLSQIFGELLMLIEADKRGPEFEIELMYRKLKDEPKFYVPKNVYVIGMMNIADRSLAMVDYALRRRFAFVTLEPKFSHSRFKEWLQEKQMPSSLIDEICLKMERLNQAIQTDRALGRAFQVGHSYFCPRGGSYSHLDRQWLSRVMQTEILPLLGEYWFDNPSQTTRWSEQLLGV